MKGCSVDFTNLLLAPLAAVVSVLVVIVSLWIRARFEHRALALAFAMSLFLNALIVQPWYYTTVAAFIEGVGALVVWTILGFALGALVGLLIVKATRYLRELMWLRG